MDPHPQKGNCKDNRVKEQDRAKTRTSVSELIASVL